MRRGSIEELVEAGEKKSASGAKAQQREDKYTVNRQGNYSRWRYAITEAPNVAALKLYTTDFDFVEWSFNYDGELVAAAVFDATQADNETLVGTRYLDSIIRRFETQLQGKALTYVSKKFGCSSYILLFREDCSEFWVYNWTEQKGWKHMTADEHIKWLSRLHAYAKVRT